MIKRAIIIPAARACIRLAHLLIVFDRQIRTSRGRGVKMVVDGGSRGVLLVRHTYGNRHWTFPGGRVRREETTALTARRELEEELSLTPPALRELGSYPIQLDRRLEVIDVYLAESNGQDVSPDPIELAEARWFDQHRLPDDIDPSVSIALGLLAGRRAEEAVSSSDRLA
jgi:8-oxo-dGTP pyrophosphatase MutT (NUDIX family)